MESEKKSVWVNFNLLNKPVYLAGFQPAQAMGMLLLIAVFLLANPKIGIGMAVAMMFVGSKIRKENSRGNPSFVDSYIAFQSTKKRIIDNNNVLSLLSKEK